MRIVVNSAERNVNLRLPSGLLLNPVGALLMPKLMQQNNIEINYTQALAIVKALNGYRRNHPEWIFLEASTSDGTTIEIRI